MEEKIDRLLKEMDKRICNMSGDGDRYVERALFCLLTSFKSELPKLDDYFHKAFRQVDCITSVGSGLVDGAIYNLLHASTLFWELFGKITTGDDNVVLYEKEKGK